eukprot:CAMPEP_0177426544 /NCGR_PEP_ID=MMETSP0368-20130122/73588_1 /TAXON_ID=447022 ORGANISM="Scrippsiella hangoei-like, Strain SHHI-4" /NCGR_SAMPLE_ID=MMETSP0368 /ASSEMBLY_ACC=CAM_ASM_000363 /LENGTH=191 /DNA_ID=CAMNT_0018896895 /DNA_START=336 /DNA_END=908 /DNA_ORIENTATION=+
MDGKRAFAGFSTRAARCRCLNSVGSSRCKGESCRTTSSSSDSPHVLKSRPRLAQGIGMAAGDGDPRADGRRAPKPAAFGDRSGRKVNKDSGRLVGERMQGDEGELGLGSPSSSAAESRAARTCCSSLLIPRWKDCPVLAIAGGNGRTCGTSDKEQESSGVARDLADKAPLLHPPNLPCFTVKDGLRAGKET